MGCAAPGMRQQKRAGMLVQIDASPHDWREGRGPRLTLFAAIDDATGEVLAVPETSFGMLLLGLATFNLVAGYGAGMLIAGVAVTRRGWPGLVLSVGLMPLYWIMISLTAYRAHLWRHT